MRFTTKNGLLGLSLLHAANAHMGMTNFYVDGADQVFTYTLIFLNYNLLIM